MQTGPGFHPRACSFSPSIRSGEWWNAVPPWPLTHCRLCRKRSGAHPLAGYASGRAENSWATAGNGGSCSARSTRAFSLHDEDSVEGVELAAHSPYLLPYGTGSILPLRSRRIRSLSGPLPYRLNRRSQWHVKVKTIELIKSPHLPPANTSAPVPATSPPPGSGRPARTGCRTGPGSGCHRSPA